MFAHQGIQSVVWALKHLEHCLDRCLGFELQEDMDVEHMAQINSWSMMQLGQAIGIQDHLNCAHWDIAKDHAVCKSLCQLQA